MNPQLNRFVVSLVSVLGVFAVIAFPDHDAVVTVILAAIGGLSCLFAGMYAWRSNWRATIAGRIIMRLMLCVAAIGVHGTVNAVTDAGYWGRDYIRPLLLLGVAVAVLDLLLRMVWLQRGNGDDQ